MPMYLVIAAISFATILFGSHCSAKDLEPVEAAKAQREKIWSSSGSLRPATGRTRPSYNTARLYVRELTVGQVGDLKDHGESVQFKVISVVDGSNLLAEYDATIDYGGGFRPDGTISRIGKEHHYVDFWLKGFSTKGIVDGDDVKIPWVVKVTGTQKYNGHTVLLIEPYIKTEKEQQAEAAAAQRLREEKQSRAKAEVERRAADEKARWRVWTDASGAHTVEARFKWVVGDEVKLAKRDGSEISIPLEKLSEEDRGWIQDRTKKKQ